MSLFARPSPFSRDEPVPPAQMMPQQPPPQKVSLEYGTLFWVLVGAITIGVIAGVLIANYIELWLGAHALQGG